MDISLAKLRQLVTVAQAKSFSRAAEMLHVSQPALSRSITAIEQGYGVRIFERGRSGTIPTAAGAQVIAEAEDLLRNARTFDHNFRMIARGERGDVSIGMGPAIAASILAGLAGMLLERHPGVNLQATIRPSDILVTYLLSEAIELFISPPEHVELPGEVETRAIGFVRGGFYVRAEHPLAARNHLTLEEILQYPLASSRRSTLPSRVPRNGGMFVCDNYAVVYELMLSSDVVCITAGRSIEGEVRAGRMAMLRADDFVFEPSAVVVATIRGRSISPVAREIVDYCRDWLAGAQ